MKKLLFIPLISLLFIIKVNSQNDTEDFQFIQPHRIVSGAQYNYFQFVDARPDTTNLGIIQRGMLNRKVKVVPTIPIGSQLGYIFYRLLDTKPRDGEFVFVLQNLSFAEITGSMSEKGYCYFSAKIFVKKEQKYQELNSIDTLILIKSLDVTKSLLSNGSNIVTSFIVENLDKRPTCEDSLSWENIKNLADFEKQKLKLYTTDNFVNGYYLTYNSFKNQIPDGVVTGKIENFQVFNLKYFNNTSKIKPKNVFAIILDGQPFISTNYGFYKLNKMNNDFFFVGKAKVTADGGTVAAASFFFGILGGLLASNAEAVFYMKIDYKNGSFIRLKELNINSSY